MDAATAAFFRDLKALGVTQGRLAAYLGIRAETVSEWHRYGAPLYAVRIVELLAERMAFGKMPL